MVGVLRPEHNAQATLASTVQSKSQLNGLTVRDPHTYMRLFLLGIPFSISPSLRRIHGFQGSAHLSSGTYLTFCFHHRMDRRPRTASTHAETVTLLLIFRHVFERGTHMLLGIACRGEPSRRRTRGQEDDDDGRALMCNAVRARHERFALHGHLFSRSTFTYLYIYIQETLQNNIV